MSLPSSIGRMIRDPVAVSLGALLFAAVLAHRTASPATITSTSWVYGWYSAFLALTIAALSLAVRRNGGPARRFWQLLLFGFSCWLATSLAYLLLPGGLPRRELAIQTTIDIAFLLFYLGLVLAGEIRPEAGPPPRGERRDRTFEIAGLVVFSLSLLAFFVLVPNLYGAPLTAEGYTLESYLLYLVLDAYLVLRFLFLAARPRAGSWRSVYLLLAGAAAVSMGTNTLELLTYLPGTRVTLPAWTNVLWYLTFPLVVLASRNRLWIDQEKESPLLGESPPVRRPHRMVFYILLLFLLFAGFGILELDRHLVRPRGVLVLLSALVLGMIARVQIRELDARARRLLGQKEAALASLRELTETLEARVEDRTQEIRQTRTIALVTLARLTESRDTDTGRHLERIAELSRILAFALQGNGHKVQFPLPSFVEQVYRSSPLHDIGKVGIPDAILLKAGPLTDEEWEVMRTHTSIGGDTLRSVMSSHGGESFLEMAMEIAYSHHERWDGNGYPFGRSGTDIPLAARIVTLVDAYDAITSARPYKPAYSHEEAIARIHADSGTHFDPTLVTAFLQCEPQFAEIRSRFN